MLRLMVILLGVSFLAACAAMPEEEAAVEAEVAAVEVEEAPVEEEEEAMVEETVVEDTTAQVTVESTEVEPRETVADFVALGDTVYFAFDSHELDAEAQRLLIDQAAFLSRNPQFLLTIEGHCDERGTREYNYALGERRANAVSDYLTALGVDGTRIGIVSFGKELPVVLGSSEEAWAQNRRTVVVLSFGPVLDPELKFLVAASFRRRGRGTDFLPPLPSFWVWSCFKHPRLLLFWGASRACFRLKACESKRKKGLEDGRPCWLACGVVACRPAGRDFS